VGYHIWASDPDIVARQIGLQTIPHGDCQQGFPGITIRFDPRDEKEHPK